MEYRFTFKAPRIVKEYAGLTGCVLAAYAYCSKGWWAKHFFPKLATDSGQWDAAYFMTQCFYAFIIAAVTAVFAKGKPTRKEIFVMTVFAGLASGDVFDRAWKIIYDPTMDLTKITEADVILLIVSIYYAFKIYVATNRQGN